MHGRAPPQMPSESWTTDVQFRLLLGCGALVSAVPLIAAFYAPEAPLPPAAAARFGRGGSGVNADGGYDEDETEFSGQLLAPAEGSADTLLAAPGAWTHWLTLIGTGGAFARVPPLWGLCTRNYGLPPRPQGRGSSTTSRVRGPATHQCP